MRTDLDRELGIFEQRLGFYCGRVGAKPIIPPDHVYLSLTNRCNLRCRMCDISKNPTAVDEELSTDKIKDIIIQIKSLGVGHLIFSGGEPFLRQDLIELVEFATIQGIDMVDIITNGTLLNTETIQKLIKAKLNHMTISLDGLRDTNDMIRGEGVFDKAIKNIDELNHLKLRYALNLPTVGINFTIMGKNIGDILPIIEFARHKKCNAIFFQPVLFNNTKMYQKKENILWPSAKLTRSLNHVIGKVIQLKSMLKDLYIGTEGELLKVLPYYFMNKRAGRYFKCYEAIKRIVITYNGKLWSCGGIYGDLNKHALKEIWFSEDAKEMRNKASRCNKHCLQDCVYVPSDIFEQTNALLKRIKEKKVDEKYDIKNRLVTKLGYYIDSVRSELQEERGVLKLLKRAYLRRELVCLNSIKNKVQTC